MDFKHGLQLLYQKSNRTTLPRRFLENSQVFPSKSSSAICSSLFPTKTQDGAGLMVLAKGAGAIVAGGDGGLMLKSGLEAVAPGPPRAIRSVGNPVSVPGASLALAGELRLLAGFVDVGAGKGAGVGEGFAGGGVGGDAGMVKGGLVSEPVPFPGGAFPGIGGGAEIVTGAGLTGTAAGMAGMTKTGGPPFGLEAIGVGSEFGLSPK